MIDALNKSNNNPHILFSSSSQEEKDNTYGRSKREGRQLFLDWANRSGGKFTGLIVPNVFGPFGQPNYNSFIATFCHKLTHNEVPSIDVDGDVKLIYVGDLVADIIEQIRFRQSNDYLIIPHRHTCKVSQVLNLLRAYRDDYFEKGIIPSLNSTFEVQLFNTFRSYFNIVEH